MLVKLVTVQILFRLLTSLGYLQIVTEVSPYTCGRTGLWVPGVGAFSDRFRDRLRSVATHPMDAIPISC